MNRKDFADKYPSLLSILALTADRMENTPKGVYPSFFPTKQEDRKAIIAAAAAANTVRKAVADEGITRFFAEAIRLRDSTEDAMLTAFLRETFCIVSDADVGDEPECIAYKDPDYDDINGFLHGGGDWTPALESRAEQYLRAALWVVG